MRDPCVRTIRPGAGQALIAFGCFALLAAPVASTQERAQQPYRAAVDMVLVDCIVLDGAGHFVHGLTAADFRIFEEGEQVEIDFFSEQHFGRAPAPPVAPAPGETTHAEPPAGDADVIGLPRYLVLFVDALNMAPNEWDRLRPELVRYLHETLTPADQVLVAMLTPDRRLRVAPEFTSDAHVVEAALSYVRGNAEIRERTRLNEQRLVESLQVEEASAGGGDTGGSGGEATALRMGAALAGFFALERRDEVLHTLDTITGLAEHLDQTHDVPGPKSLLLISGGIPEQPGSNYFYILEEYAEQADPAVRGQGGIGGYDPVSRRTSSNDGIEEQLTAAVGYLNRLNYTVYTIDARGAADFAGDPAASRARTPISSDTRTQIFQDAVSGLGSIARGTGGLAFSGTNNFAAVIDDIHADTAYRYVLGYVPPQHDEKDVENGRFYRVRVEVSRSDVRVRARQGYVDR
jgi:VWFA-related protein